MKTLKLFFVALLAAFTAKFSSCTGPDDSKNIAEKENKEKLETMAEKKDAQFLVDIAEINLEEIQLAQLAQSKSTNKEMQGIAQKMEDEHSRLLDELKELAMQKGISIPTESTEKLKDEYKKLSEIKEMEFNEEYCNKIVQVHKDAVDKVEKASKESNDDDIKAWAIENVIILKKHLDIALSCQPITLSINKGAAEKNQSGFWK